MKFNSSRWQQIDRISLSFIERN